MAISTVSDLITRLRFELEDVALPYLWDDDIFLEYINQAQREFVRHTNALPDATTFTADITAGDPWIDIDPLIYEIRKLRLTNSKRYVGVCTLADIETRGKRFTNSATSNFSSVQYHVIFSGTWEDRIGVPEVVVTDMEQGRGRLVPIPVEADSLSFAVYRYPNELRDTDARFEIPERYRYGLVYKVKALAYQKQDIEAFNMARAADFEGQWQKFLLESYRDVTVKQRNPVSVRYGGI
jgi:hypothetical protein